MCKDEHQQEIVTLTKQLQSEQQKSKKLQAELKSIRGGRSKKE
jgi:hypothetical protein